MNFRFLKNAVICAMTLVISMTAISCTDLLDEKDSRKTVQDRIDELKDGDVLYLGKNDTAAGSVVISKAVTIIGRDFDFKGAEINVKKSGVVVEELKNIGTLTVGEEIGEGDFTLCDSDVSKLVVNGGGAFSIHLTGVNAGSVEINKQDVRIHMDNSSKNKNKNTEIDKVTVNTDCKIDSSSDTSFVSRVLVAKEVTKVTLSGKTVVSTIVVNAEADVNIAPVPVVSIDSSDVKVSKGAVKKYGEDAIYNLVLELLNGVSSPAITLMTKEEVDLATREVTELTVNSRPGEIVMFEEKQCLVTVNKFISASSSRSVLNTETDYSFREAMVKEYSDVSQFIELYCLVPQRKTAAQASNGSGGLDIIYYYFDRNLNYIARIRYQWLSVNIFAGGTREDRANRFDALSVDEIMQVSPEGISYDSYMGTLKDRLSITTHYLCVQSKTDKITDAVVDLNIPVRTSIQKDFVELDDGTVTSMFVVKKYFTNSGELNYTEHILTHMGNLGETIALRFNESKNNYFLLKITGNGFDNNNSADYVGQIEFSTLLSDGTDEDGESLYKLPLSYTVSITENEVKTFNNSFYGDESLCARWSGNNIEVVCPTPPGTPLAKYCKVILKKNAEGIYEPDYEAYRKAYENDFVANKASKFWLNKDALIAADVADGTFTDALIKERNLKWNSAYEDIYSGYSFVYANGTWDKYDEKFIAYEINKIDFATDKTFKSSRMYYSLETRNMEFNQEAGYVDGNTLVYDSGRKSFLLPDTNCIQLENMARNFDLLTKPYVYGSIYEKTWFSTNEEGKEYEVNSLTFSWFESEEDAGEVKNGEFDNLLYYKL